jgi:CHAT domain-containing protein
MTCGRLHLVGNVAVVVAVLLCSPAIAQESDPHKLLAEADRLAWLRAWTKAEPLFAAAERAFAAQGDQRNAMYAHVSALRGQLPRLPVPEVSERLAELLDDPLVFGDERLRLRALIIKGETDTDLDPSLSQESWTEALALAEKLGESAWANRARGELGLIAFLLGDTNAAIVRLGQAMKVAESNGDASSLVRWMTLFGHGYFQLGQAKQALDFYDRALKLASTVPELQFPVMTHLGKGNALVRLERLDDAKAVLADAQAAAESQGALGYQAELVLQQALIAEREKDAARALTLLTRATDLALKAGGNRIVAEIALEAARVQRQSGRISEAETTLAAGIDVARRMGERLLLPRLLGELADLHLSGRRYVDARELLVEASDLLEGLLTNASSPWVRSRLIESMDAIFLTRIRLEGAQGQNATRMFAALEQARGRSMSELVSARDEVQNPGDLRAGERRIAALQLQLLRTTDRRARQRLLDQIFTAEEQLAPAATELFMRARSAPRKPATLQDLQRRLRPDEVFLEFALGEPSSYVLVATRQSARVHRLAGRVEIRKAVRALAEAVRAGREIDTDARQVGTLLIDGIKELRTDGRVVISADGDQHQLPFELLVTSDGKRLLESHVVSYVPSGSALVTLRTRQRSVPGRLALAVASSPSTPQRPAIAGTTQATIGSVTRGVYDVDAAKLPALPSANDEARAVIAAFGQSRSTILVDAAATEQTLKREPLHEYAVLHFAAHGIVSTKFPARSALFLQPGGDDDGLLQAREILRWRLGAELVTLSACDTGTGDAFGQEGVASLVRPFLAAGSRSVVANLWTADDFFSLALMREFYRNLASSADVGQALRLAKIRMLEQYGPQAVPKLWSGVLVYGDAAATITGTGSGFQTRGVR